MARPPDRQAGGASPSSAPRARAPRRGPRWSRSTSRTPTAATSHCSPATARLRGSPSDLVTRWPDDRLPALHRRRRPRGRRSSWPSTSTPGRSGSSTGSPAGRPAPAMPPSRRTGNGSSSGFWCLYGDSCPPSSRSPRSTTQATIHPDGRGLRLLRLNTGADSGTWSPDGKRIAFRCRFTTSLTLSFRLCF